MRDSVIYEDILSEGVAEGEAKGRLKERLKMLIKLGALVMGPPSQDEQTKLRTITDLGRLGRIVDSVSPSATWAGLLDQNKIK